MNNYEQGCSRNIYQESNSFQTASAADREAWLRSDDLLSWSVRIHNIYVYL